MAKVRVNALWDEEAGVFVAQSEDVRGLVVEAESMSELISELKDLIPEMMQENGQEMHGDVDFEIEFQHHGTAHAIAA
jgi:hypothetical protein